MTMTKTAEPLNIVIAQEKLLITMETFGISQFIVLVLKVLLLIIHGLNL